MNIKKLFLYTLTLLALGAGSIAVYHKFFKKAPPPLYQTIKPKKKTISQDISSSGALTIKDPIVIGSLVSGTVKKLYVKENQHVKKGQLLTYIDPGTGDTDYQRALFRYQKWQKDVEYKQANFDRQKVLYQAGQLAKDEIERLEKELVITKLELKQANALLEKEKFNLENRKIVAVQAGFLTAVNITEGSGVSGADVSTSSAKIFEIAPNICHMEAKLDIDESDIGQLKPGQSVSFTVNTYPDQTLYTKIRDIGFSPKTSNGVSFYKATVDINNEKELYRPGMAINAKIKIAKAKNALCVKNLVFQINPKALKKIAQALKFEYTPLSHDFKKQFKKNNAGKRVKFVWLASNKSFNQIPVILGITDGKYFEITSGLKENAEIISDIAEDDVMEKIYKKWFKGPLK